MLPKITIGCPVRDRGWILPLYLKHLMALDYPKELIGFCFLLNDSTDNSEEILYKFKEDHESEYRFIDIHKLDIGTDKDYRTKGREIIYHALVTVRNHLLDLIKGLYYTDYFFSVDSDILVPPHALKRLIEDKKKIVAGVIWNDYVANPEARYPNVRSNLIIKSGTGPNGEELLEHYYNYPLNQLFKVYMTGAVYLLAREVYSTCRYSFSSHGEDYGFCKDAIDRCYDLWADSRVFCHHIMVAYQLICGDCSNSCKSYRVYNNTVMPELKTCKKKRISIVSKALGNNDVRLQKG